MGLPSILFIVSVTKYRLTGKCDGRRVYSADLLSAIGQFQTSCPLSSRSAATVS
jgi:hypothetical protein